METNTRSFDEQQVIKEIKRYLPAQAPLKDFIFQNNLAAFQHFNFHEGLNNASEILGYKVYLSLHEFRSMYASGRIRKDVLDRILTEKKGVHHLDHWKEKLVDHTYHHTHSPRVGLLRSNWKKGYKIDLNSLVHTNLFRVVNSYIDQGISIWNFPVWEYGFLGSIKDIQSHSFTSFFSTKRAKDFLMQEQWDVTELLKIIVGDESLFEQYLFDQQFAHQGWSGMVSVIEDKPHTLIDQKKISLKELIVFELLLEIDALDKHFGEGKWQPLSSKLRTRPEPLFQDVPHTEYHEVLSLWQDAFEWTYFDEVLAGLQINKPAPKEKTDKSFQAMFCIDDRECSVRRYLEQVDPACDTYGTPGFFNVEFYFQPLQGKHYTKLCPAPMTPKYLIKEVGTKIKQKHDVHFEKRTHSLLGGLLISQTLGFWSAFKLITTIFRPTMSSSAASSFRHMDKAAKLTIQNTDPSHQENGWQIGFTVEEMATRVEGLLRSVGLLQHFAPVVYMVGHGASSVNNPYYTTMDCGACSCRPGSVNARAFCFMANHKEVRTVLASKGIVIPEETRFIGGLHDTTRDDVVFFDEETLSPEHAAYHAKNIYVFERALELNAKERSRRFESINTKLSPEKIHKQVQIRSVSLFEPRPELDHATNALTVIGRRELTKDLFLDRRSFLNSFDYTTDLEGKYLLGIMGPIAPVCGGISLNYYFARVDNQKLGSGTKLPHNVMGLVGVANGIEGDLRPGLPSQMIESHDPVRHLVVVEHFPEVVLATVKKLPTYEWYLNGWMHLVALNPETKEVSVFKDGAFEIYTPLTKTIEVLGDLTYLLENTNSQSNTSVYLIPKQ
jgi:uncharacterized protein